MPVQHVPNHPDLSYVLLEFTPEGLERPENSGSLLSDTVLDQLANTPVTDVFLISHGWKADIPAAIDQYDRWIDAMAACALGRAKARQHTANFHPLLVGLHWPSLPWGDEQLSSPAVSFSLAESTTEADWIEAYTKRIADTPSARSALATLFEAAMEDIAPDLLPSKVREAYNTLNRESGLGTIGEGASPGDDRESFDPDQAYRNASSAAVDFGPSFFDGILGPLRQLSFWKMKERANQFGQTGGHQLLRSLQRVAENSGRAIRFHLVGHSFGCIVMSAILRGPDRDALSVAPVHSLYLVQGALSLWSYCGSIPAIPERSGYFHSIISTRTVTGPIVATLSEHDFAVGTYYPIGAGIAHQVAYTFDELPKYGGVGSFGVRGPGIQITDRTMLDIDETYGFEPGKVYNIDASKFISKTDGAGGAHNDIAHPEVAHVFWEAVIAPDPNARA